MVDYSVAGAFAGASLAWLFVSVAAWFGRRKLRIARRSANSPPPAGANLKHV
jgi:hypothetical protein